MKGTDLIDEILNGESPGELGEGFLVLEAFTSRTFDFHLLYARYVLGHFKLLNQVYLNAAVVLVDADSR